MKDFLKYVMVFILITMAIWSNDRPKDYPITYTNQIEREMAYVKKSIKEVNGVFKIFKNAPNFVKITSGINKKSKAKIAAFDFLLFIFLHKNIYI